MTKPPEPGKDSAQKHSFGFKPSSEELDDASATDAEASFPDAAAEPLATAPAANFERSIPSLERSWIMALVAGFGGTLVGGLIGLPGAPILGAALAFVPLWLRIVGGSNSPSAALACVAWMLACIAAGAGLGAEGAGQRFEGAVPLSSLYLAFMPILVEAPESLMARWPSLVPASCLLVAIVALGRTAQALWALVLVSIPVTWMAARSARFTAAATQEHWDAGSALLASVPPQHLLVLGGAMALAVVAASPFRGRSFLPPDGPERRVFLFGAGAALVGLVGEPLFEALRRSYSAI